MYVPVPCVVTGFLVDLPRFEGEDLRQENTQREDEPSKFVPVVVYRRELVMRAITAR